MAHIWPDPPNVVVEFRFSQRGQTQTGRRDNPEQGPVEKGDTMKKWKVPAAVSVIAIAALVTSMLTPATSQPPPQRTTLTFFDPRATDFEKEINEGARGFGAGDWAVIKDSLFDPATCEKVATAIARFTFIKSIGRRNGYFMFEGGVLLADGKITIHFPAKFSEFESPGGATGAVTGGTGAYKDARGDITVTAGGRMCDTRGDLIVVDLLMQ
jgi:hypothetical protein